jgi:hypothetical protein
MVTEFRSTIQEFQEDVESMCQWLESLNIGIDKNRVAAYRKTFARIVEHLEKGTVNELEKSVDFAEQADNFHDASELIFIHRHLKDQASPIFLKTLAQAVNGQLHWPRNSLVQAMRVTKSLNCSWRPCSASQAFRRNSRSRLTRSLDSRASNVQSNARGSRLRMA